MESSTNQVAGRQNCLKKKIKNIFIFYYLAFCQMGTTSFIFPFFLSFFVHCIFIYIFLIVRSYYLLMLTGPMCLLDTPANSLSRRLLLILFFFFFSGFILSRIIAQNHMLLDTTEQSFLIATHHAFNRQ